MKILFVVIVIFIAACIETDIYLPAFPDMMAYFGASEGEIQQLLSWNFLGICLSSPLYGPLSDALGRKKLVLVALGLFLVGSFATLFATQLPWMILGRTIQGLGSGGCFILGTAILFDAFEKEKAVNAMNHLNTIIPLTMAAAPMIGGYLNYSFGFRSNFVFITFTVLLSLIACLGLLPETLPREKRIALQGSSLWRDLKQLIGSLPFWQLTLATSLPFAGYIAFLSGTSVLFVLEFGMSKTLFPLVQGLLLAGWVVGSLILKRSLARFGTTLVKKAGLMSSVVGGVILGIATWLSPRDPYLLTLGMVFYAFGANWMFGLYLPESMELFPNNKGLVASVLTSVRLCIAATTIELSAQWYNNTVYPLSFIVIATVVIIWPLLMNYELTLRTKSGISTEPKP